MDTSELPRRPFLWPMEYSADFLFQTPTKRIDSPEDMDFFLNSQALSDVHTFLLQLNVALFPRVKPAPSGDGTSVAKSANQVDAWPLKTGTGRLPVALPKTVQAISDMIGVLNGIVDEVAPSKEPRRFGNVAFREWHRRASEMASELVTSLLRESPAAEWIDNKGKPGKASTAEELSGTRPGDSPAVEASRGNEDIPEFDYSRTGVVIDELQSYLVGAFGSAERLDFGTGHEMSFIAFLACLWKLGVFGDVASGRKPDLTLDDPEYGTTADHSEEQNIERALVVGAVQPYLAMMRRIILNYTLEPAGSHGAWGLDDYFFVPYILGSAQLAGPIKTVEDLTTRGSLPSSPDPVKVTDGRVVDDNRDSNMYFSAIGFIHDVKKGNFWEHSPLLFDISRLSGGWSRINNGLLSMYKDHVFSKFPVVQHFYPGAILGWQKCPRPAIRKPIARVVRDPGETEPVPNPPSSFTPPTGYPQMGSTGFRPPTHAPMAQRPGAMPPTQRPGAMPPTHRLGPPPSAATIPRPLSNTSIGGSAATSSQTGRPPTGS